MGRIVFGKVLKYERLTRILTFAALDIHRIPAFSALSSIIQSVLGAERVAERLNEIHQNHFRIFIGLADLVPTLRKDND